MLSFINFINETARGGLVRPRAISNTKNTGQPSRHEFVLIPLDPNVSVTMRNFRDKLRALLRR